MAETGALRIAVLGTRGLPNVQGGVEKHCEELYPRLVSMGCRVEVYARKGYVAPEQITWMGIGIRHIWTPRKKSLEAIVHTFIGTIYTAFNRDKFDILHIHAIGPSLLVPFARLLGLRVVVTNHGPDYDRQKWGRVAKGMLRLGESFGTRFASAVIAVSRPIQEALKANYGREVFYIPNGVNLPDSVFPGKVLEEYGLNVRKYILTVGRLVPEKGFHDLIEAFREIDTDWKLVIAGGADHEDAYSRSLKETVKKIPNIVMTGFIKGNTLAEVFSNAGLFVLPSYHEGLPIALLEAMDYGLPCLASNIPANLELVNDSDLNFSPGDIAVMRKKIISLLRKPPDEKEILKNRRRIEEEFNWDKIAEEVLQVYRQVTTTE